MSKAKEINEEIIHRCLVHADNDEHRGFIESLNTPNNFLRIMIQSISEVMAEEVEKLEGQISKKQTRQLRKKGSPYDTSITAKNRSRGPG